MGEGRESDGGRLEAGTGSTDVGDAPLRTTLSAYAELVRVPNLFTAPPDVLLGAALVSVAGFRVAPAAVVGLAIASTFLYAAGTTLNDAFDAPVDERERPERPIPSGRISRRTAFGFGFALLAVGIVLAFVVAGGRGGLVAGMLALAVVLYDGLVKGSAIGYLTMGATRGLNVALGTTAVAVPLLDSPVPSFGRAVPLFDLPPSTLAVPVAIAGYIAMVTFVAARETEGADRGAVVSAAAGAIAAVLVLGWHLVTAEPPLVETVLAVALAAAFLVWIGRPLRAAYADPAPETVGPAVGACVVGLVLLDAAFAAAGGIGWALATAAFLIPAVALSRAFDVT